jgi:predicted chitinase
MFTKEQLAKWEADGFTFPPEYQEFAVEQQEEIPKITSINFISPQNKIAYIQNFQVMIKLSTFDAKYIVRLFVDSKVFSTHWSNNIRTVGTLIADAYVILPVLLSEKIYEMKVEVCNYVTQKVEHTVQINIKVKRDGEVTATPEEIGASTNGNSDKKKDNHVSFAELKQIFDTANDEIIKGVVDAFNEGVDIFKIDNCLRKAHFFAQAKKEVGSGLKMHQAENMNYRTDGLINGYWYRTGSKWVKGDKTTETSGYFKIGGEKSFIDFSYTQKHPDIAEKYGRKDLNRYGDSGVQVANGEMIANYVYSNKMGNKGPETGDGSKYRGKGLIQLTWKNNYIAVNKELKKVDKTIDIVDDPDSILGVRIAVLSAMGFWSLNKINKKIGTDKADDVVDKVSAVINPGEKGKGWKIRKEIYSQLTKEVFNVQECNLKK